MLEAIDAELIISNCATEDDIIANCADADGILLDLAPMTRKAIAGLTKCKVINRYGVGFDNGFFAEVSAVAETIAGYTGADKINYAIYGDIVSHFHVHLVPKHRDGLQWGGPFTDTLPKVTLAPEDFSALAAGLTEALLTVAERKKLVVVKTCF